jgi:hypothetical protein
MPTYLKNLFREWTLPSNLSLFLASSEVLMNVGGQLLSHKLSLIY